MEERVVPIGSFGTQAGVVKTILVKNAWLRRKTMYDGEDVGVCQRVTLAT